MIERIAYTDVLTLMHKRLGKDYCTSSKLLTMARFKRNSDRVTRPDSRDAPEYTTESRV